MGILLRDFIERHDRGFIVGKIARNDIRDKDVVPYIDVPTFILSGFYKGHIGWSAIALRISELIPTSFYTMYGGLAGKVFRSLLPHLEELKDYEWYSEVNGDAVLYIIAKALDMLAETRGYDSVVWIFSRFNYDDDSMFERFFNMLEKIDTNVSHKVIIMKDDSRYLKHIPSVEVNIPSKFSAFSLITSTLTDKENILLGALAIVGSTSEGHVSKSFVNRLSSKYEWIPSVLQMLIGRGIIEEYDEYLYSFVSYDVFRYFSHHWREASLNLVSSVLLKNKPSNVYMQGLIDLRKGHIKKGLREITYLAWILKQQRKYRYAISLIRRYYMEYRDHLNLQQKLLYLRLSSLSYANDELALDFAKDIAVLEHVPYGSLPDLAEILGRAKVQVSLFDKLLSDIDSIAQPIQTIVASAIYSYKWKLGQVDYEFSKKMERYFSHLSFSDPVVMVRVMSNIGRIKIVLKDTPKASQILDDAIHVSKRYQLPWFLQTLYNNLFIALANAPDKNIPIIKLRPLLYQAYETSLLYSADSDLVAFSNFISTAPEASEKWSNVQRLINDFMPMFKAIYIDKNYLDLFRLYWVYALVASHYGHFDIAEKFFEEAKKIIEEHREDISPAIYTRFLYLKAMLARDKNNISEIEKVIKEWKEVGIYSNDSYRITFLESVVKLAKGEMDIEEGDDFSINEIYRYSVKTGQYYKGIEMLSEKLYSYRKSGAIFYVAEVEYYLGELYRLIGDHDAAYIHWYNAFALFTLMESGFVKDAGSRVGIDTSLLSAHPEVKKIVDMYATNILLSMLTAEISSMSNIQDILLHVLVSLPLSATGTWVKIKTQAGEYFLGYNIIEGITNTYKGFLHSPFDITDKRVYSEIPSYMYIEIDKDNVKFSIYVENQYVGRAFSTSDLYTLRMYADSIASIIHGVSLSERAMKDFLTGLYSRWFFLQELNKEWERVIRRDGVISFLFIDIDHFKHINDTYGHDVGDAILKEVASVILDNIRVADIAGRYGGEEMVVALPDTDEEGAKVVAERIRRKVQESTSPSVTVSIGLVSCFPQESTDIEECLKKADEAMYNAKNSGRNMVCVYKKEVV